MSVAVAEPGAYVHAGPGSAPIRCGATDSVDNLQDGDRAGRGDLPGWQLVG